MIPIRKSYDVKDIPSVAVDTKQNDLVPRKKILYEDGDIPAVIEELTVTSNGDYTPEEGVDGFAPVHVNVSDIPAVIEELTVTSNGDYTPEEGVDGFAPVHVNVSPVVETLNVTANGRYTPDEGVDGFNVVNVNVDNVTSKILSQYDFSEAEYDLVRSINPNDVEPRSRARLDIGLYNATYDSTNGVVSWSNGYGCCYPFVQFEKYKDYKIIIEFGNIQRSDTNDREFLQLGASCRVGVGNTGIWRSNSSGTEVWTYLTLADNVANQKIEIKCTWGHGAGTNIPTSYWYIKFPNDVHGWRFLCNMEYNADTNLRIGRATSQSGCYPGEVKNIEVIESKWIISPAEETITDVAVANFDDAYLNSQLKECEVEIKAVQSGTGDPSPTNIRPITGFNEVDLYNSPTITPTDGTLYKIEIEDSGSPLTVYGGTLDVTNGVLTVDRAIVLGSSLTWTYESNTTPKVFRASLPEVPKISTECISSSFGTWTAGVSTMPDKYCGITGTQAYPYLRVRDDDYTDATTFGTSVASVQFVYNLVTPVTYQLAQTHIDTLFGENYITCSTGDILRLTYLKEV